MMEDFNSDTDSDYTSYWRDWVGAQFHSLVETLTTAALLAPLLLFILC